MKYVAVIIAVLSGLYLLGGMGMFTGNLMNDFRAYFVCGFSSVVFVLSLILFKVSIIANKVKEK